MIGGIQGEEKKKEEWFGVVHVWPRAREETNIGTLTKNKDGGWFVSGLSLWVWLERSKGERDGLGSVHQ